MSRMIEAKHTVTILSGQTTHAGVVLDGYLKALSIFAPGTLPETVTLQVAPGSTSGASDFRALQSGGADITVPANKAVMVTEAAFRQIRLVAGAGVAADRTFTIVTVIEFD